MTQRYDKHSPRNKSVRHTTKSDDIKQSVSLKQPSNHIGSRLTVRAIKRRSSQNE